jgi:hypothetical protein
LAGTISILDRVDFLPMKLCRSQQRVALLSASISVSIIYPIYLSHVDSILEYNLHHWTMKAIFLDFAATFSFCTSTRSNITSNDVRQ